MELVFALGGSDPCWIWLPITGRTEWPRWVEPQEPATLLELHASSARGELSHPGEVPLFGSTTLQAVLGEVEAELGPEVCFSTLRLKLGGGSGELVFFAHRERDVRLEAADDEPFPERLAHGSGIEAARWRRLLGALRQEFLTERCLRAGFREAAVDVRAYRSLAALGGDAGGESFTLEV